MYNNLYSFDHRNTVKHDIFGVNFNFGGFGRENKHLNLDYTEKGTRVCTVCAGNAGHLILHCTGNLAGTWHRNFNTPKITCFTV